MQLSNPPAFGRFSRSIAYPLDTMGQRDKHVIYVTDMPFSARGDGVTDDTAAIQRAVNFIKSCEGGTIVFPKLNFKVTAPIVCDGVNRLSIQGVGGIGFGPDYPVSGSRIFGTHAGDIFTWANSDYCSFDQISFDGAGCTGIAQSKVAGQPTVDYLAKTTVTNCHFFGAMACGIRGNLIYGFIDMNTFGYFGTVGALHQHIVSTGTGTNVSNLNQVSNNRFYKSKGATSVVWNTGASNVFIFNNWEQNNSLPLSLQGCPSVTVSDNWFELNSGTDCEIFVGPGTALVDSTPTIVERNSFVPHSDIVQFIKFAANAIVTVAFNYNAGNGVGKLISNDNSKITSRIGNNLGVFFPSRLQQEKGSWNVTDASGAGLSLPFVGTWERNGNIVDVNIAVVYPANASNANSKIGGFPYGSTVVSVGSVMGNLAGGVSVAMDAGANTMTFFAPGTITPFQNQQLAGKTFYLTLRYPAS